MFRRCIPQLRKRLLLFPGVGESGPTVGQLRQIGKIERTGWRKNIKYIFLVPMVPIGFALVASKFFGGLHGNVREEELKDKDKFNSPHHQAIHNAVKKSLNDPLAPTVQPDLLGDLVERPIPIGDEKALKKVCHGDQGLQKVAAHNIENYVHIERIVPPTKKDRLRRPRIGHGCVIHYDTMLSDGTLVDTTRGADAPKVFLGRCDHSDLVCGLELALPHLSLGEQARIHIPAQYAYKNHGWESKGIPPGADLIIHVHVLEVR